MVGTAIKRDRFLLSIILSKNLSGLKLMNSLQAPDI